MPDTKAIPYYIDAQLLGQTTTMHGKDFSKFMIEFLHEFGFEDVTESQVRDYIHTILVEKETKNLDALGHFVLHHLDIPKEPTDLQLKIGRKYGLFK